MICSPNFCAKNIKFNLNGEVTSNSFILQLSFGCNTNRIGSSGLDFLHGSYFTFQIFFIISLQGTSFNNNFSQNTYRPRFYSNNSFNNLAYNKSALSRDVCMYADGLLACELYMCRSANKTNKTIIWDSWLTTDTVFQRSMPHNNATFRKPSGMPSK